MRNKIILIGAVAAVAYILGARSMRPKNVSRESVGHQAVRLWNDPQARKTRKQAAAKLAKTTRKTTRRAAKAAIRAGRDVKSKTQ